VAQWMQRRRTILVLWFCGVCTLAGIGLAPVVGASPAHAANWAVHYAPGYTIQGSWLCYGWNTGYYRCTQHWHTTTSGVAVSDVPGWLPNGLSGGARAAASASNGGTGAGVSGTAQTSGQPCAHNAVVWPAVITQWSIPSGCFGRIFLPNPANYPVRPSYGWCNWWPEVLHPQYSGSDALHLPSHSAPTPGAVVFFGSGVQGASWAGHYAQVVAVAPDHYWVLITEMNFYWRGGGWQKVDYRYIHVGAGVVFRY